MKHTVLILSDREEDCRAVSEAALSLAARPVLCRSSAEASEAVIERNPLLFFCDASRSEGGGLFGRMKDRLPAVVLIVNQQIERGLLRSCKRWVSDYITSPILREAAASRIRQALRMHALDESGRRSKRGLEAWLDRLETATSTFDPFALNEAKSRQGIAARLLERKAPCAEQPTHLIFACSDGPHRIVCDLYASTPVGVKQIRSSIIVTAGSLFLLMAGDNGLFYMNYFDRGRRFEDFQSLFPPEILDAVGPIRNLAGFHASGCYIAALNYGRPVNYDDALFLKGIALPDRFIARITNDLRGLSDSFLATAHALALAADAHDDNGAHVRRMNEYARTMAEAMGLPAALTNAISYSAQLHDIGKIYIHPDVLFKPLRLTPHEYEAVKRHPALGARMLGDAPYLQVAKNIALTHHECWDGSGYPAGLSAGSIPVEGAIVKLADVYDALRTMHAYKKAYTHDDACRLILEGGGDDFHEIRPSHFHPDVLSAFRKRANVFDEIFNTVSA